MRLRVSDSGRLSQVIELRHPGRLLARTYRWSGGRMFAIALRIGRQHVKVSCNRYPRDRTPRLSD